MRVCQSWALYLRQFAHRYVELSDVLHERVPVDALSTAYRILWEVHGCTCGFSSTKYEVTRNRLSALSDVGVWKAEILEAKGIPWRKLLNEVTTGNQLRGVRVLLPEQDPGKPFTHLDGLVVSIEHMGPLSNMQYVTTLNLGVVWKLEPLKMPNLRHLALVTGLGVAFDLVSWLGDIGHQLVTLWWDSWLKHGFLSLNPTIWEICPRITSLSLPAKVPWTQPPLHHPITTLAIKVGRNQTASSYFCAVCQQGHTSWCIQPWLAEITRSRISTIVHPWRWETRFPCWLEGRELETHCMLMTLVLLGFRVLDFNWMSLDEYIVQRLEVARGKRKSPARNYTPIFS